MSNSCARQSFGEKKEEKIDVLKYFVCVCLKIFKIIYLYSARNLSQVNKKKIKQAIISQEEMNLQADDNLENE